MPQKAKKLSPVKKQKTADKPIGIHRPKIRPRQKSIILNKVVNIVVIASSNLN